MTGPRLTEDEIKRLYAEYQASKQAADPYKPTNTPRIGSESTGTRATIRNATPEQVAANRKADGEFARGVARQAAQGATFGFADELEAGARSALGPRDYRTVRDEIRGDDAQFQRDNPGIALTANLAGGILSGGALAKGATMAPKLGRALMATGLAPKIDAGATFGQRMLQTAKTGAVAGGMGGVGIAKESTPADLASNAAIGATVGAGAGTVFGLGAELFRAGRNLVSRVGQGREVAGPIRRAIWADSPEESAAKRVLQRAGNQNMTLDELAARSAAADGPDVLGEVIGEKGIRDIRTARGLGYEAPDMIEDGLRTRARNDVDNVRRVVRTELGEQIDDKALPAEKVAEAQAAAGPLYEQALEGVTITDPRLADWMQRPAIRSAYARARKLAANDGVQLPPAQDITRNANRGVGNVPSEMGAAGAASQTGKQNVTPEQRGELARMLNEKQITGKDVIAVMRGEQPMPSFAPKYNSDAVWRTVTADDGAEVGTLGDFLAGPKIRDLYGDALDVAVRRLDAPPGGAPEGYEWRGAFGTYDGQPTIFISGKQPPDTFMDTLLEEAAHAMRGARGRTAGEATADLRNFDPTAYAEHPAEKSAARMVEYARTLREDAAPVVPSRGQVSVPDATNAPELPTLTGPQVKYIKHAIDDQLKMLEGKRGGTATTEYAQLMKARTDVDALLYEFANSAEDGSNLWGAANRAYAKPMQEAEAFTEGVRSGRGLQSPDVPRMLDGEQAAWRSRGVANTLQDDLARMPRGDGDTRIANPASTLMGSDAADARLRVAAGGDGAKIERIQDAAANTSRRLRTRNIVTGNSQTAEKLADMAEQGMNPAELIQGATSPVTLGLRAVGRGANALARNALGQDMDAMAKLLMAGAPGQMTRAEAVASLQRMEPFIRQQLMRQLVTRGAIGGAAGRAAVQPSR